MHNIQYYKQQDHNDEEGEEATSTIVSSDYSRQVYQTVAAFPPFFLSLCVVQ